MPTPGCYRRRVGPGDRPVGWGTWPGAREKGITRSLDTDPPLRIAPVLIAPGARTDIRLNKEGTRIGTEVAPPR